MSKKRRSKEELDQKIDFSFLKKIKLESVLLVVFLGVMLYFISIYDSGLLSHENGPTNYLANDMFAFAAYADLAKYEDDVSLQPDYMSAGQTDSVNFFSMQGAYIAAQLSQFTGVESFDFIIHLNLLFLILSILMIFQFLSKIDIRLAVFSLPLSLLVFKWPFLYTITWGMHLSNINLLFIAASFLCLYYLERRYIFIILGILNGAGVLAHAREFFMFNLGVGLYFFVRFLKDGTFQEFLKKPALIKTYLMKNKTGIWLRNYLLSIPVTLIMMFRHLPVLDEIYSSGSTATIYGISAILAFVPPDKFHHVFFHQFGFYQYLIFIGAALGIYFMLAKKMKKMDIIVVISLFFLLSGFFSILGNKTTQIRHIFPVLLMPFVGIFLFTIYNTLKQSVKIDSKIIFIGLFLLILIPTAMNHTPSPISEYAFSDPFTWEGIKWVRENVEQDKVVLNLYGDRHNQPRMFQLMRKIHFNGMSQDYLQKVSSRVLSSTHRTDWGLVHFYMRQPKFNELQTIVISDIRMEEKSLCEFDYIYTDKLSQYKEVQDYTGLVIDKLKKEHSFVQVFENQLVVVLKNNNPGAECFEDEVLA